MLDHVDLWADVDPQLGIHKRVKAIKARSSRVLRQEFPWLRSRLRTLWTSSHFVATVVWLPVLVIKRYLDSQKGR